MEKRAAWAERVAKLNCQIKYAAIGYVSFLGHRFGLKSGAKVGLSRGRAVVVVVVVMMVEEKVMGEEGQ